MLLQQNGNNNMQTELSKYLQYAEIYWRFHLIILLRQQSSATKLILKYTCIHTLRESNLQRIFFNV